MPAPCTNRAPPRSIQHLNSTFCLGWAGIVPCCTKIPPMKKMPLPKTSCSWCIVQIPPWLGNACVNMRRCMEKRRLMRIRILRSIICLSVALLLLCWGTFCVLWINRITLLSGSMWCLPMRPVHWKAGSSGSTPGPCCCRTASTLRSWASCAMAPTFMLCSIPPMPPSCCSIWPEPIKRPWYWRL